MFKFLKLAFKNVFRNKRRTFVTILILVAGTSALILMGGYVNSTYWELKEIAIYGQYGHIQVFNKDYFDKEEDVVLQYGLENVEEKKEIIKKQEHVKYVTGRAQFMGLISNGDKSVAFLGTALEPDNEKNFSTKYLEFSKDSKYLNEQEAEDEVLLTRGLAKSLKCKPGDYLTIMSTTTKGALNALDVKVIGTFSTGIPEYDARALQVKLKTAHRLLNTNKVTNLVVVLDDTENTDSVFENLTKIITDSKIKKWIDLAHYYKAVAAIFNQIFTFLGVIIFVVVVLSGINTMMMSVFERTREIGTMLAIGTSRKRLVLNFLYEGLIIGIIGAFAGSIIGNLLAELINHSGINMPPPPGGTMGYPLRIRVIKELVSGVFIFTIITNTLSAIFPAYKASKMKIVDALRYL